jgi:DNA replication protein DnaC
MTTADSTSVPEGSQVMRERLRRLGLFGMLAQWNAIAEAPWLKTMVALEEQERQRRSLERRPKEAFIGAFKPLADFDWAWPKKIDRDAVEELLSLRFIDEGSNAVLLGPNGVR